MQTINSMDFTIAVASNAISIEQDMTFLKAALLYSDTITLVSSVVSTYFKLTNEVNDKNEKTLFNLVKKVLPLCERANPSYCDSKKETINQFERLINSKQYNSLPLKEKYRIRKALYEFRNGIRKTIEQDLGETNCNSLKKLIDLKKVKLHNFQTAIYDDNAYAMEFYDILKGYVCDTKTFPLFDDISNGLIKSAIKEGVIALNSANGFEVKHANLTSKLLIALPSFEFATVDEILDIRKELETPLIRFRSKLLSYDSEIQSMPWDDEFQFECIKLYQQEVAPAVLEIDELTKESSFIKNLGYSFLTNESAVKNAGELVISIAMWGAITAFTDVLSSGQIPLVAGGAYAVSKVGTTFKKYRDVQSEISRKDMYFYHRAGKLLKKLNYKN